LFYFLYNQVIFGKSLPLRIFTGERLMSGAEVIRLVLLADILVMAFLAVFYLWQRKLSGLAFIMWGLVALVVPVLGPFLVIAARPGRWNKGKAGDTRCLPQRAHTL
jgi:hypothetical protein